MINTDVLIVGGGISGLHTAYELEKRGISFIMIEARDRLGGRILSKNYSHHSDDISDYDPKKPAYDLGPSWFWPGQKNMANLVHELNLIDSVFPQQGSGESLYEDQQGNIQKGFHGISMEGIYRMRSGIREFIVALENRINDKSIKTSTVAESVQYVNNQVITSVTEVSTDENKTNEKYQIKSNKIIIALPPRIALSTMNFEPALTPSRVQELNSFATWMAGHAKLIAVYDKPFWLEQGLSGDAISQLGPIREIHDASSHPSSTEENGYALFGFIGVSTSYRKDNKQELLDSAIQQLIRLFGVDASKPKELVLQDWAEEEFTSTNLDQTMNGGHPTSSISNIIEPNYDHCLIWSGTETASHHEGTNGLLEGALEASIRAVSHLE